jgi:hypothetical protein
MNEHEISQVIEIIKYSTTKTEAIERIRLLFSRKKNKKNKEVWKNE